MLGSMGVLIFGSLVAVIALRGERPGPALLDRQADGRVAVFARAGAETYPVKSFIDTVV